MDVEIMSPIGKMKKAVRELEEGRQLARRLQSLFGSQGPHGSDGSQAKALHILGQILRSLSVTLAVLRTCDEDSQMTAQSKLESSWEESRCSSFHRSGDSGESKKRPNDSPRGRGRYKRKNTADSWTKVTAILEDEHTWRKYGQKEILNFKFPRSYYRCTHKYTRGCNAVKQVQKLDDGSNMYQVTYITNHTCSTDAPIKNDDLPQQPIATADLSARITDEVPHETTMQDQKPDLTTDNVFMDSDLWNDLMLLERLGPSVFSGEATFSGLVEDVVDSVVSNCFDVDDLNNSEPWH